MTFLAKYPSLYTSSARRCARPQKLYRLLFPGGITGFTGRLVPGFLLRHLLLKHHLPGYLSRRQRLPQTKIVLAPKPIQSWGVRRNLVRRRIGVLVAANQVSVLEGGDSSSAHGQTGGAMAEI